MPDRQVTLKLPLGQTLSLPAGIDVEVHSFDVADEKALRQDNGRLSATARTLMHDLDDGRRAALTSLITAALTEMASDVDKWLAGSLVATPNERIGVFVLFRLGNIDDQILLMQATHDAEQQARIDDLARMANAHPAPV